MSALMQMLEKSEDSAVCKAIVYNLVAMFRSRPGVAYLNCNEAITNAHLNRQAIYGHALPHLTAMAHNDPATVTQIVTLVFGVNLG
jgi:hypothetical protein